MAMYINTNMASLNAQRNLASSQSSMETSIQRLSSGLRVNSAKDDAAGLAISTRMESQIRGMSQAMRNANDGISMVQTADGALATAMDAFQRMRELAVQSKSGTYSDTDRTLMAQEYVELQTEITRLATDTKFNGQAILNQGTFTAAVKLQVSADSTSSTIDVTIDALNKTGSKALAATTAATSSIDTAANAATALTAIDDAINEINTNRATLGAAQNRLGYAISNLQTSVENQSAAKSRIVDADFASETAKMTRNQILQQAGTAMLAQANQLPNQVMTLLRG